MDALVMLVALGVLVGVWFWLARTMRNKGSGWFIRHLAGSFAGSFAFMLLVMVAVGTGLISAEPKEQLEVAQEAPATEAVTPAKVEPAKWYTGGTLHDASALDWQAAEQNDKLATSADWLAALWNGGKLKPAVSAKLKSVDDLKPLAEELVRQLDAATEPEADAEQNRKMFINQKMGQMAVMTMAIMGWVGV